LRETFEHAHACFKNHADGEDAVGNGECDQERAGFVCPQVFAYFFPAWLQLKG
jgi:hypothetical protein